MADISNNEIKRIAVRWSPTTTAEFGKLYKVGELYKTWNGKTFVLIGDTSQVVAEANESTDTLAKTLRYTDKTGVDVDTLNTDGRFVCDTNIPADYTQVIMKVTTHNSNNNVTQQVSDYEGKKHSYQFRTSTDSGVTWGAWETDAAIAILTQDTATAFQPDRSLHSNFNLTLTDNTTIASMLNSANGDTGTMVVIQDSTGGHGLAFDASYVLIKGFDTTTDMPQGAGEFVVLRYENVLGKIYLYADFKG